MKGIKEYLIVLGGWTVLFSLPLLYLYYDALSKATAFDMHELLETWRRMLPFLFVFCLHHFLLIRLFRNRKFVWYGILVAGLIALMACCHRPPMKLHNEMKPRHEMRPPHEMRPHHEMRLPHERHFDKRPHSAAPFIIGQAIMALMMMGADLGLVLHISNRKIRQRVLELEKEKLEMELGYLKYQINPHFFMNTLNNIHALMDIDTELAKRTVIDLSRMMRYALYDSSEEHVPLMREIDFIRLYISLMKLRYNTALDIQLNVADEVPNVQVPPLLLICFVENAFKHGVSNLAPSYVHISITLAEEQNRLMFRCENSRILQKESDSHHGIGIANARKRLQLLYGEQYSLTLMDQDPNSFIVCLTLPIQKS